MKTVVDENQKRDEAHKERAAKAEEILDNILVITSVEDLDAAFQIGHGSKGYRTVAELDLQLDWHIAKPVKESASSQESSASGIPKAKTGAKGRGNRDDRYNYLKEAISRRTAILELVAGAAPITIEEVALQEVVLSSALDVDDDGYDSEDDYYGR
jgi:hypothetical protein